MNGWMIIIALVSYNTNMHKRSNTNENVLGRITNEISMANYANTFYLIHNHCLVSSWFASSVAFWTHYHERKLAHILWIQSISLSLSLSHENRHRCVLIYQTELQPITVDVFTYSAELLSDDARATYEKCLIEVVVQSFIHTIYAK